jgi:hypothetical protein
MPRSKNLRTSSAFSQVQKQARQLLATLRVEIRSKEGDLRRLKEEESQLSALIGQRADNGTRRASGGAPKAGSRINWGTVLEQMPKQFKASDVRSVRGLKDKRSSEIFAAITRWIEAGSVKRKDRGLYERVK